MVPHECNHPLCRASCRLVAPPSTQHHKILGECVTRNGQVSCRNLLTSIPVNTRNNAISFLDVLNTCLRRCSGHRCYTYPCPWDMLCTRSCRTCNPIANTPSISSSSRRPYCNKNTANSAATPDCRTSLRMLPHCFAHPLVQYR